VIEEDDVSGLFPFFRKNILAALGK
jgi:hypothetical protein